MYVSVICNTPITPNGDLTATMATCENSGNRRRVVRGSLGRQSGRPIGAVTSPKVVIWSPWSRPIFEHAQNLRPEVTGGTNRRNNAI